MSVPLFDTHAHLISDDWNRYPARAPRPDLPARRTEYTVTAQALVDLMDEHDVPAAMVVQRLHVYGYDNRYILDSAQNHPGRLLPVVMLDTQDPATPQRFGAMVREEGVRGFRMANTRPSQLDTAWMSSPAAMQVWQVCADLNVPVTLIIFHNQLSYVLPLLRVIAKMFPRLPVLIDHLGTAYGVTQVELGWSREAGIAAVDLPSPPDYGISDTIGIFDDTPNVHFKLTEVNLENLHRSGIPPAQLVRRMADRFGADRLLWGSDVGQSLRWSFAEKAAMAREAGALLTPVECAQFLHENAGRLYSGGVRHIAPTLFTPD